MTDDYHMISGRCFFEWTTESARSLTGGGVYGMVRSHWTGGAPFTPLYWGIAGNIGQRLNQHDQWEPAIRQGMNVVLICHENSEANRRAVEECLIKTYPTPLNVQHNLPYARWMANVLAGFDPAPNLPRYNAFSDGPRLPPRRSGGLGFAPASHLPSYGALSDEPRLPRRRLGLLGALDRCRY